MPDSKIKERIADWENRKAENAKLPSYKRQEEENIKLDFSECKITNLDFILEIDGVISIDLCNNQIEDVTPLTKVKGLRGILLQNNLIKDALPLLECENLKFINLSNNKLPALYGKKKKLFSDKFPDAVIRWNNLTRTPNLW
jgi:Leucine-rich repeat (LRR) protein